MQNVVVLMHKNLTRLNDHIARNFARKEREMRNRMMNADNEMYKW